MHYHEPVLVREVLAFMKPRQGGIYLDGTVGTGGHTEAILTCSAPTGRVIAIDTDGESLEIARHRLAPFGERVHFVHGRYEEADVILEHMGISGVDGILLDLGVSTYQLEWSGRGFSFQKNEPLDMRMDTSRGRPAWEVLHSLSKKDLSNIIREWGEERWAGRIGDALAKGLPRKGEVTTREVVELIVKALPRSARRQRIHPATRTFQALRIAVNRELEALELFLHKLPGMLREGGCACIISFHSLEDRMVKRSAAAWKKHPQGSLCRFVHNKVIRPRHDEVVRNPRARSARMRVIEKVSYEKGNGREAAV